MFSLRDLLQRVIVFTKKERREYHQRLQRAPFTYDNALQRSVKKNIFFFFIFVLTRSTFELYIFLMREQFFSFSRLTLFYAVIILIYYPATTPLTILRKLGLSEKKIKLLASRADKILIKNSNFDREEFYNKQMLETQYPFYELDEDFNAGGYKATECNLLSIKLSLFAGIITNLVGFFYSMRVTYMYLAYDVLDFTFVNLQAFANWELAIFIAAFLGYIWFLIQKYYTNKLQFYLIMLANTVVCLTTLISCLLGISIIQLMFYMTLIT